MKDDPLLDSYLQNEISVVGWYFIVKRKAVAELLAELKDFEVRMNGREPGMLLRRTRARGAAVSMGGAVIVVERLDGDGTLPEHAPAATAFEKLAASRSKLGRRFGENVFHIASAGGTLDFEMGVVYESRAAIKAVNVLVEKKHNSFEGTVVVSAEAARSGIDFDKAFPRAFVVYDPGLAEAVAGMVGSRKPPPRQSAATVAILLPRTATQQHTMGLDSWTQGQRTEAWLFVTAWARTAHVGAVVTWQRNGFNPLTAIRRMWTKLTDRELVIKALLESQSVLILFAHGTRRYIALPDGTRLTVDEVRNLKLTRQPVVLLLSCEGAKPEPSEATQSFSEALKAAGAAAVFGGRTEAGCQRRIVNC